MLASPPGFIRVRIIVDGEALKQGFLRVSSVYPANHHSAIAPHSSTTDP
jgi:hypothetical protein